MANFNNSFSSRQEEEPVARTQGNMANIFGNPMAGSGLHKAKSAQVPVDDGTAAAAIAAAAAQKAAEDRQRAMIANYQQAPQPTLQQIMAQLQQGVAPPQMPALPALSPMLMGPLNAALARRQQQVPAAAPPVPVA
jgi:hypothetical protein